MGYYHWCAVSECKSTTIKTPDKLWIKVPSEIKRRNTWLKLARRDPKALSRKTELYFCEDHFDLEKDMENFMRYKIMGSVKKIAMRPNCIPSRFDCQANRKCKYTRESRPSSAKRQRKKLIQEIEDYAQQSSVSCVQDSLPEVIPCENIKVHIIQKQEYKAVQAYPTIQYKSKNVRTSVKLRDRVSSTCKLNLHSTIFKIKKKPQLYLGLPKQLYFLIDVIRKYTKLSEQHILLCLLKIRLNRTFSQLGDDFNLSASQASKIFLNKLPIIAEVLIPFIKPFTVTTIENNIPIAFRHKYNKVTCIIDCFEIEIQKLKKPVHEAMTWSECKKTSTIKYLVACRPDGLVSFISPGYGGSISDINLLEHSKFLDNLKPGSCILAIKGFKHIELCLSQKYIALLRPSSVSTGLKLSEDEVTQTKQIASLGMHVEKVICRIREFAMLNLHSVINYNLISVLDLCVTTACALVNIQGSFIK